MKILVPILCFGRAGGYRTLSYMATEWVKMGHNVDFVVSVMTEEPYYPTIANIVYIGKNAEICLKRNKKEKIAFKEMFHSLVEFLRKYSSDYDAVIANHNITAVAVNRGSKTENFYYVQAYEPGLYKFDSFSHIAKKLIAYRTYKYPLTRIVNADIYKNYKNLKSNYVIPPGLDLSVYHPKKSYWDQCSPIKVGCIGRKEEWKGSQDVADAVEILKEKNISVEFVVAFHPVKCSKFKLVKPDGDINLSEYYRDIDILVAPAKLQLGAIHYPVIEAMACGTSVITTGYYPANDSNSYLVPISDPGAIADAIIQIINNYETAVCKIEKALEEIKRFDWKRVSSDFINIILDKKQKG